MRGLLLVDASQRYFFDLGFAFLTGVAALAGIGAGEAFNAARWAFKALMSSVILLLRAVRVAIFPVSLAIAAAVLDTGAFFAGAFTARAVAFTGAALFVFFAAAFTVVFFAVAI